MFDWIALSLFSQTSYCKYSSAVCLDKWVTPFAPLPCSLVALSTALLSSTLSLLSNCYPAAVCLVRAALCWHRQKYERCENKRGEHRESEKRVLCVWHLPLLPFARCALFSFSLFLRRQRVSEKVFSYYTLFFFTLSLPLSLSLLYALSLIPLLTNTISHHKGSLHQCSRPRIME